jgi:acetyltransferase-like isoleucine patch superfamily enzyme
LNRQWLSSRKETILLGLGEWIPKTPGKVLRNWLYPHLFAKFGNLIQIQNSVEFVQPRYIHMGNSVRIGRNSCISSTSQSRLKTGTNAIYIENFVSIGVDVQVKCHGKNSQIYLREKVILDRGVDIRALDNGLIDIGRSTYLGPYTCIAGPGPVKIGNNCLIGSQSGIYGNNHYYRDPNYIILEQGIVYHGIVIEDDCWLGCGVKVLDRVVIGRGSVIGAGAIVTKNIPAYSVAVGVPAKVIAQRR